MKNHLLLCLLLASWLGASPAQATDIANEPLASRSAVQAKPNLMFILDNSGSMNWSFMPDDLGRARNTTDEPYTNWYGYGSAQCNGVAYNPAITYAPPLRADGSSYANASFSAAPDDGYTSAGTTTNLGSASYYRYSGTQNALDWTYTSAGVVRSTFYLECSTKIDSTKGPTGGSIQSGDATSGSGGAAVFTKVLMSTQSAAQQQNYANWYAYYRKRYLLMRTAMGRAMAPLDANYRVGFSTIGDTGVSDGSNYFRDVKDFDATQKANFYGSLYGAAPNGGTPLRQALAKVGRYFANKATGQGYDPMQYACQRNYALLSTDGYWNGSNGVQLDGRSAIGQQDGDELRPMRDDTTATLTTVVTYTNTQATRTQSGTQTATVPWTYTVRSVAASPQTNGSNRGKYRVSTTLWTYVQTLTRTFVTPQTGTATFTRTTVSTDGVITSGPTDSAVSYSGWGGTATETDSATPAPTASSTFVAGTPVTSYESAPADVGKSTQSAIAQGAASAWSPSPIVYATTAPVANAADYRASAPVQTTTTSNGTANTLADVAEYFYKTDLRNSALGNCSSASAGSTQDVCQDLVRRLPGDSATWQHMATYTIGLGVSGTLPYDRNYLTQRTGAYADLKSGARNWPAPPNAASDNGSEDARNVDDLWHAAVNGRGMYYSARDTNSLTDAIASVITDVQAQPGAGSAAATSSLELVPGDGNRVYQASYTTQAWTGDLQALTLGAADAAIGSTPVWSAQAQLDATPAANRTIYFNANGSLQAFSYANLGAAQKAYFDNLCSQAVQAAQCASLQANASDLALANSGTRLVDYLRGDRTLEAPYKDSGNVTHPALYRAREHVLGDIINGAPVHVGTPPFAYADAGYAGFVSANTGRERALYVAANDGMLHAFAAADGSELWAYVPSAVMPQLYALADTSYATRHRYFTDGAPVMGDVQIGGVWKTILVAGFNGGGRGYYALDITSPRSPRLLWEFSDANMGLSFGNPIITKRADGTWIVVFSSGYNNGASSGGDGRGHLYVLNAATGALLQDIATSAGSAAAPSGLAKINAWIDSPSDNTAKRFYGGDLLGNLWRFDADRLVPPFQAALQLAQLRIDAATPQPITTEPETAEIDGNAIVAVATGRYLGVSDITDATQQGIYAIKDPLTATGWGDVRADAAHFVVQQFTLSGNTAAVSNASVDWRTQGGWRLDLPHARERVNVNMGLQYSTLAVATAIPSGDACASGGQSWRYYIDLSNGGVVTNNPAGMLWSNSALIAGLSWVKDTSGNVRIVVQNSDGTLRVDPAQIRDPGGTGAVQHTSWRELVD